jgi:integral membrane protein
MTAQKVLAFIFPGWVANSAGRVTKGLSSSLRRYQILAYTVGVGLAVLVFIGIPLQYGLGIKSVNEIVGPLHGFAYMVYLLTAVDLARRARFTLLQMAMMIAAGFLPLVAFIIERRVSARLAQAHLTATN